MVVDPNYPDAEAQALRELRSDLAWALECAEDGSHAQQDAVAHIREKWDLEPAPRAEPQ